jgi:hypothetical protein
MPVYSQPVGFNTLAAVAISGRPAYFYGSLPENTQDTLAQVTNVALTSNVASVTATIQQGNIPVVGNLISIQGTVNTSGLFNVSNAVLTGVTGTASTGIYVFTFALTHANVSSAADSGKAIIPIAETYEAVAANQSVAIYVPAQEPVDYGVKSITVSTTFPTLQATTGAATVTLYTSATNQQNGIAAGVAGSEWTSMGVVATAAAGAQTVGPLKTFTTPAGRFFCLVTSGVTGTNTITSKMLS